jgi:hypothetical protein
MGMMGYRIEVRPPVEITLGKIRDPRLRLRIDTVFNKLAGNHSAPPSAVGAESL